jgi:hypothetical protein
MAPSEPQIHIIFWRQEPPSLAQQQAWRWLWRRLLGQVVPYKEALPEPASAGQETRALEAIDRE